MSAALDVDTSPAFSRGVQSRNGNNVRAQPRGCLAQP